MTPGHFAHRLLSYLWTALAFSRDFHTTPICFYSFLLPSVAPFHFLVASARTCISTVLRSIERLS